MYSGPTNIDQLSKSLLNQGSALVNNVASSVVSQGSLATAIRTGLTSTDVFAKSVGDTLINNSTYKQMITGPKGEPGNLGDYVSLKYNLYTTVLPGAKNAATMWCADGEMCQVPVGAKGFQFNTAGNVFYNGNMQSKWTPLHIFQNNSTTANQVPLAAFAPNLKTGNASFLLGVGTHGSAQLNYYHGTSGNGLSLGFYGGDNNYLNIKKKEGIFLNGDKITLNAANIIDNSTKPCGVDKSDNNKCKSRWFCVKDGQYVKTIVPWWDHNASTALGLCNNKDWGNECDGNCNEAVYDRPSGVSYL